MVCRNVINKTNNNRKIILIWNKWDLLSQRKTEVSKTKEFSDKMGVELIEKSAKDCLNIENSFMKLANGLVSDISLESLTNLNYSLI